MLLTFVPYLWKLSLFSLFSSFQTTLVSGWANVFWLIVVFLIMLLLNRWISIHVKGVGLLISMNDATATWLYFFLFLPGILIHELSHYIVAILLGAKPTNFSLWPQSKQGRVVLGSVEVRRIGPVGHSLVGVAPLVFGSLAVWFIARFLQFDLLGETLTGGNIRRFFWAFSQSFATPDFWLWLYLLFAISNAMLPSPADRIYWAPVLIFFGGIVVLLVVFDWVPVVPEVVQELFFGATAVMIFALTTVVGVDIFFILFILFLESLLSLTTGRKISY